MKTRYFWPKNLQEDSYTKSTVDLEAVARTQKERGAQSSQAPCKNPSPSREETFLKFSALIGILEFGHFSTFTCISPISWGANL